MASIFYVADDYRSHLRAARGYQRCLHLAGHHLVSTADAADLAIVHVAPHKYAQVLARHPALQRKPCVCYAVWETSVAPPTMAATWAQEVWTASRYCSTILGALNPRVRVLPHVVDVMDAPTDPAMQKLARSSAEHFVFLYVTKLNDERKNTEALLRAFARVHARHPYTRLLLKTGELEARIRQRGVTQLRHLLTDAQLASLYAASDAYVSPHRSEGWGLTISDAIAYGLPTIATGYSGNLDFMHDDDTYLVASREVAADAGGVWAEIDEHALIERMCEVCSQPALARAKAKLARERIAAFSLDKVAQQVAAAIAGLGAPSTPVVGN